MNATRIVKTPVKRTPYDPGASTSSTAIEIPPVGMTLETANITSTPSSSSAARSLSFNQWDYSPFKRHLKISNTVHITRKKTLKTKTPPAISGREYVEHTRKLNDSKTREQEKKEERRVARIAKKNEKCVKKNEKSVKRKRVVENESESSDEELPTLDADDTDASIEETASCFACLGRDGWDDNSKWIGCGSKKCYRWFHKLCLSDDIAKMSDKQIHNYKFYCKVCEKRNEK